MGGIERLEYIKMICSYSACIWYGLVFKPSDFLSACLFHNFHISVVTSTLSNVVFEHLPSNDEAPNESAPITSNAEREDKSTRVEGSVGGQAPASRDGGEDARKQWGEGGVPVVELLLQKQLQTATYAVNDGNTG